MKRYLLLIMMSVLVSVGTWAADVSGTGISGATDNSSGKKVQTLVVSTPGALAAWVAANTGENYDNNNPFEGLGGSDDFYSLKISGTLSAEDFAVLNSTACAAFSRFPRIDMSEVTLASGATSEDVCSVVFGPASFDKNGVQQNGTGATFIVLPNGVTSADDVTLMAGMKGKGNSSLKVVGAYDGTNQDLPELALYSFAENELSNYSSQMMFLEDKAMVARLAGTFGDKDLVNNNRPLFGYTPPCIWDFTGATFTACTVNPGITEEYYAYDDPFCDGPKSKPGDNYQTNAFWYFANYAMEVVDIKLPTGMTELPPRSIYRLGQKNVENAKHKAAYKAYYEVDDAYITANKTTEFPNCAPIPDLIIPDNYAKLDYECGFGAHIKHLVVGSGTKVVEGAAFSNCLELEDLDFGAGLSNCYLGDNAFKGQVNSKMKHIALSEGVVSLGNYCFQNAQQLESIRLPETLINMGDHCFDNCLALNSITIPGNVDKIGKAAFNLCPFTDIYLTTTDPAKIPMVWSAGTNFLAFDGNCTFYHGHLDGWEGGVDDKKTQIDGVMTFDEAAPFYYMHWNGMPVLHFPSQLAEAVRSQISSTYAMKSADNPAYGLPLRVDMDKRDDIPGADLGSSGAGKYTRDGWAQFMLMKEFSTDPGGDLYFKEYDDVWYTMCFPFDLSDEQLAGAFNETFNIVDFSAVEINKEEKTLTLHFNNVAVTDYKDTEGNHYKRTGVRETDPTSKFSYNVYTRDGVEYHHVTTSSQLSSNKTKTFAPGTSMADAQNKYNSTQKAYMIDGILATAGHPYMIHPAIGVNDGGTTKKRCNFSGVEWKPQTQWAEIFEKNSRTIDLGIKKTLVEYPDSNYNHPGYSDYAGQKYTFIGNPKEYVDGAQAAIGDEPQVPEEPVFPVRPDRPENTLTEPTERIDEPEALTAKEQELVSKLTDGAGEHNRGPWYNVKEEITANWSDDSNPLVSKYKSTFWIYGSTLTSISAEYGTNGNPNEAGFNFSKATFNKSINYATDYAAYQANKALWDAYNANQAAWNEYNNWNQAAKEAEYNTLKDAYDQAVAAHTTWENKAKAYKVQIPQHAYFLGRAKGSKYPKYYREKAAENYGGTRTTGLWPQFTAVIKVNAAAVSGIESKLDANAALSKGFEMAFNEDFEGEMYDVDEIKSIIEEAEKQGKVDVEYLDVVVNINGQVVRSGSTSLEGLPRGLYIVNGKKYFVK